MSLSIRSKQILILVSYLLLGLCIKLANAGEVKIAVASNFLQPMKNLAEVYESETGHIVKISSGSTGKLFAQISHGAPYDLFFAANSREPEKLETQGLAINGSRFTYAVGEVVLWSKHTQFASLADIQKVFEQKKIHTIALANPKTAPYGIAAQEVLKNLGVSLRGVKLIKGENINQAWQYTQTGNADIGFIAASQWKAGTARPRKGLVFYPPKNLYSEIEQQAVMLSSSKNADVAQDFLNFIKREDVQKKIAAFGYGQTNVAMLPKSL
ncbi:MAG: molybdate ABC transporter substrate-binding protein [Gammaproteobacteria bacterium]|nr:molybdate ABC transporter substrate-binding protein [Gammaproteobacteria bacterium]